MDLTEENIQSDKFYETFKNLVKPITERITACNEALNARIQQRTRQPPRNRRLPLSLIDLNHSLQSKFVIIDGWAQPMNSIIA